jgi:hypothetical protein
MKLNKRPMSFDQILPPQSKQPAGRHGLPPAVIRKLMHDAAINSTRPAFRCPECRMLFVEQYGVWTINTTVFLDQPQLRCRDCSKIPCIQKVR